MGGGGGRGQGRTMETMTLLVRWESAKPVQLALGRSSNNPTNGQTVTPEKTPATAPAEVVSADDPVAKYYVISVNGLRMPPERRAGGRNGDDRDSGAQSQDNSTRNSQDTDQMRQELISSARLIRKNGSVIRATDVKITPETEGTQVQFMFARSHAISADDKEVTFEATVRRMKIQNKFHLKDMTYRKKLDL